MLRGYSFIVSGNTRRHVASAFFEVLVLKTRGLVDVKQTKPYADILVSKTVCFSLILTAASAVIVSPAWCFVAITLFASNFSWRLCRLRSMSKLLPLKLPTAAVTCTQLFFRGRFLFFVTSYRRSLPLFAGFEFF